jgi:hypothetical protein
MPPLRKDINEIYPFIAPPLGANAAAFAREIHAPARRPKLHRQIISRGIDQIWSMDLATMHGFRDQHFGKLSENDDKKYMLLIVDVFSRFLWAFPITGKSAAEVKSAFESTKPRHPEALMVDEGREFMGAFSAYAQSKGIRIYSIYGPHKSAIAERAIRTVQTLLWRLMTARQTRRWVDLLPLVVDFYNNNPHSSLNGFTPTEASMDKNFQELWLYQYGHIEPNVPAMPAFKAGDFVRVSIHQTAFSKGYHGNWSLEVYRVAKVSKGRPVLYSLNNLDGTPVKGRFYESELQRTRFPDLELAQETTVMTKPKNFMNIERVLDATETWGEQEWLYEGFPMVWLKCKWEGLSDAANAALPRDKLFVPYVSVAFDRDGEPHPAIKALLKKRGLWTVAQKYKNAYFKAKAMKRKARS